MFKCNTMGIHHNALFLQELGIPVDKSLVTAMARNETKHQRLDSVVQLSKSSFFSIYAVYTLSQDTFINKHLIMNVIKVYFQRDS